MKGIMIFVFSWILMSFLASAQDKTVELDEIVIEGLPFEKFVSGSKIIKADSMQLAAVGQGTLANFLQENTTVYIKEQGNGMLASVSFRGTGSSHTGVFWHGINLNSLTLGNSDFNSFPIFLFDDITVQFGGASSVHGSDAIGGSIHLSSNPRWTKGSKIHVRQDFGSFGNVFSGVKLDIGNGKWESKTRIFYKYLKNNFPYSVTDRIGDSYEVKQDNAEVENYGLLQEFNRKIAENGYLSLRGWLGKNYHQVQPLMVTTPEETLAGDEILDKNIRLVGEYKHFFKNGLLQSGLGYVWDYQLFDATDVIETKRMLANLSYEWTLSDKTILKAGGNTKYIIPNVWSYDTDLTEWRGDAFLSLHQELIQNWSANLNVRKTFVPFTESPIAPSLSTSYTFKKASKIHEIRAQVERSYRVPSFNDRYWGDQGRTDLKSENGISSELGYHLQLNTSFDLDIATYYMIVDDWLAWKPAGGVWRPYNLKKVEASGIELNGKWKTNISSASLHLGAMYAYNHSILLEGVGEDDPSVGQQLPYTPRHRFGLNANVTYQSYNIAINNSFTGKRLGMDVNDKEEEVDRYFITNLSISKSLSMGKHRLSIEGKVQNVFDVEYQNVKRYAMPGRNYLMSINFFINNQQ